MERPSSGAGGLPDGLPCADTLAAAAGGGETVVGVQVGKQGAGPGAGAWQPRKQGQGGAGAGRRSPYLLSQT